MIKLSSAQRGLLEAAAAPDGGSVDQSTVAKPTIWSLVKRGYLAAISDGGIAITPAGRAVIAGAEEASAPGAAQPRPPKGKIGILLGLLLQKEGATIADMTAATGWQAHSVRGALAGAIKKERGFSVLSAKTETGRVYRVARGVGA